MPHLPAQAHQPTRQTLAPLADHASKKARAADLTAIPLVRIKLYFPKGIVSLLQACPVGEVRERLLAECIEEFDLWQQGRPDGKPREQLRQRIVQYARESAMKEVLCQRAKTATGFLLTWLPFRLTTTPVEALTDELHRSKKGPNSHLMGAIFLIGSTSLLATAVALDNSYSCRSYEMCNEVEGVKGLYALF